MRFNVAGELQPYEELAILPPPSSPDPRIRIPFARIQRGSYLVDVDGVGRAVLLTPDRETPPGVYKKYYPGGDYFPTEPQPFGLIFTPDRNTILFDLDSAGNQILHVFPDVNGDGLPDAVSYPDAGGDPFVRLNVGGDFSQAYATFLPGGTEIGQSVTFVKSERFTVPVPSAVRVLDFNQDGRQDLLLVDAGVVDSRLGRCRRPTRTHLVALISRGTGFFEARTLSVPVGDFASGAREGFECMGRGYKLSQLLDVNGDGLTDLVQVEGGQLRLYVRRGKAGLLTKVTDGYGAHVAVDYRPISDPKVHTSGSDCLAPRTCVNRGVWVVSSHQLDDGTGGMNAFQHQYGGMAADAQGRGFLGASRHVVTEVRRGAVHTTQLDNETTHGTSYPLAGLPVDERTEVPLDGGRVRLSSRQTRYEVTEGHDGRTFSVQPVRRIEMDEESGDGTREVLRTTAMALTYDAFGNLTDRDAVTVARPVAEDEDVHALPGPRLRLQAGYQTDTDRWLISQPRSAAWTARSADGQTEQRTVAYDTDPATGLLSVETVEPGDLGRLFLRRRFERNGHGLPVRITAEAITAKDAAPSVRTTSITYDRVDGTHPAAVVNSLGQVRRTDFDPRRGLLVAQADENGVRTVFTYDAFGRIETQDFPDQGDVQTFYQRGSEGPLQVITQIAGGQGSAVHVRPTRPTRPAAGPQFQRRYHPRNPRVRAGARPGARPSGAVRRGHTGRTLHVRVRQPGPRRHGDSADGNRHAPLCGPAGDGPRRPGEHEADRHRPAGPDRGDRRRDGRRSAAVDELRLRAVRRAGDHDGPRRARHPGRLRSSGPSHADRGPEQRLDDLRVERLRRGRGPDRRQRLAHGVPARRLGAGAAAGGGRARRRVRMGHGAERHRTAGPVEQRRRRGSTLRVRSAGAAAPPDVGRRDVALRGRDTGGTTSAGWPASATPTRPAGRGST